MDNVINKEPGVGRGDLNESVYGNREGPVPGHEPDEGGHQCMQTEERAERHNAGKPAMSYLLDAPVAFVGFVRVMEHGERKYSRDNWRKGLPENEVIDSLIRHLQARKNGEIFDPETGLDHYHHVTANAVFLAELHGVAPRLHIIE